MLGQNAKKLIIVCDEKTEEYANYLRQLVSLNDDKEDYIVGTQDGTVDVIVWLEKEYLANTSHVSSKEHVLFIGENKTSKKEISNMNIIFDKFGMQYGWLGKRGMMLVNDRIKKPETYDKFIEFCQGYRKEFQKVVDNNQKKRVIPNNDASSVKEEFAKVAVEAGAAVAVGGVGLAIPVIGFGLADGIKMMSNQKKIMEQQYKALTIIMYLEGLNQFLEG